MVAPRVLLAVGLTAAIGLVIGATAVEIPPGAAATLLFGAVLGMGLLGVNITYAKAPGAVRLIVLGLVFGLMLLVIL